MLSKQIILDLTKQRGKISSSDLVKEFSVSRQYINRLIQELMASNQLTKIGSTKYAFYVLPEYLHQNPKLISNRFSKTYKNTGLEEHKILEPIASLPLLNHLPENLRSIFTYAFSEMLNNAIEHSQSKNIRIEISNQAQILSFIIDDAGVGVFRNIMKKRKLKSELEAIQDLLKGKTTTRPKSHSGEGIFFTSKISDVFTLDSYGYQLMYNNQIPDVFVQKIDKQKKGTRVTFQINTRSKKHLNDIFKNYTVGDKDDNNGFDKTEIRVKLYTMGGVYVSRSQARRILSGLEKFKLIIFDFDKVPMVGQAFADEIFRVFQKKYPKIRLEMVNMAEGVKFMINRAININKQ